MTGSGQFGTATLSMLPEDLQSRVRSELEPGERLVWVAQPVPRLLRRTVWPLVVFAIPWTAFALFWTISAAGGLGGHKGPGVVFALFGVPFIFVGVGMFLSPLLVGRAASRTVYLITDSRAIVFRAAWYGTTTVRSFRANGLGSLTRRERADGSGDLVFEQFVTRDSDGDRRTVSQGFMAIEGVRDVELMLRKTLLGANVGK